jgi:hypothetical protein
MAAATFNYQGAIADADALIQYFGMDAVLRRAGSSPEDRPCRVAIIEYDPREKPADLANPTDRRVIMSAANSEVQLMPPDNEQDQLVTFVQPPTNPPVIDEILPMTCKPTKTAPAGVTVIWEFTVRR